MSKRRQYATGSVYRRSRDGRWLATIEAGWNANGSRRRIVVTARTEAAAKQRLKEKQRDIAREGLPTAGASSRTTVKQWAETWLETRQADLRPKAYATTASSVRVWVVPTIGHKRLEDLTPGDIRAVSQAQRKAGRSTSTALRTHAVLRSMLKAAMVEGHRLPPRVLEVARPVKAVSDRDALTVAEAVAVLDAASTLPDGSRWVAALLQGMRQAECLGLTWAAVDLDRNLIDVSWQLQPLPYLDRAAGTFRVPDGYEHRHLEGAWHLVRPKTGKGQRLIPVVPWMSSALTAWRLAAPESPHGLVWPRLDGRPVAAKEDTAEWVALQGAAMVGHHGGRPFHLHEARNTTATLLLEAGVDPEIIKAILGHSSIVTSRDYMRVNEALARSAMERVAERLQLR